MANKINQEESIARVYQFLSSNAGWQEDADKNGNGMLEKSEFRSYLLGSSLMWNGETSKEKDDLIDKFWKTVDTKTAGKMTNGSKTYSNKYSLDANEMKAMQDNVEAQNRIDAFMSSVKAPESLEAEFQFKWIKSVKESLINKAIQALKKGSVDDITQEWLEKAFKVSSAKATADYTALTVKNEKADSLPENYSIEDDDVLNKVIIKNYIASLENNPKDDATVAREIRELVEAYFDTANTNSQESIDKLAQYGYSNYNSLNPLQAETIKSKVKKEILEYIEKNNADIYTDEYKAQIEALVDDFATSYIAGKGANQFNDLKSFDISEFVKTEKFENLIKDIKEKQKALADAKTDLNNYVLELMSKSETREAGTRAVQSVLDTTQAAQIWDKISKLTTVEQVAQMKADIKAKFEAEEAQLKAEKEAKEKEEAALREQARTDIPNDNNPMTIDGRVHSIATIMASVEPVSYQLCNDETGWDSAVRAANKKLASFLDTLVKALKANYPAASDIIDKARKSVESYYQALFTAANAENNDNDGTKTVNISYYDSKQGKNIVEAASFGYKARYTESKVDSLGSIGNAGDSGFYVGCDQETWATDDYFFFLDLRVVLQKFMSFL